MGVDTKIYLPPTVRVERLGIALGALHALPIKKTVYDHHEEGTFYTTCPGVKIEASGTSVDMLVITFTTPYGENRRMYFHFEPDGEEDFGGIAAGYRLLSMPSTARNIAIAHRLVRLFGGRIIYKDSSEKTFSKPDHKERTNPLNAAGNGAAYFRMQKMLANIPPVKQIEIDRFVVVSGYGCTGYDPVNEVADRGFDDVKVEEYK